jgi:hypothetical protein
MLENHIHLASYSVGMSTYRFEDSLCKAIETV